MSQQSCPNFTCDSDSESSEGKIYDHCQSDNIIFGCIVDIMIVMS